MVRQAREIVASFKKINQIHVEFMQDWMTPDLTIPRKWRRSKFLVNKLCW